MSDYVKTRIVKEGTTVNEDVYNMVDTKQPMIGAKGMFYRVQGTMNVPSGEATLYRVTDDEGNIFLAKHYRMKIKEETREKMLNFLTNLKENSNVMPILDHGEYFNTPFDILPYYPDKDLSQKGPMDINFIKNIFLPSMVSALKEIHDAGIVHRDIKPENLFYLVDDAKVVIGDFGIASNLATGSTFKSTEIGRGTVGYLAPEVKHNNVHIKTDFYALGVTIVCLVAGKYIFKDMDEPQIYKMITDNSFSDCIKDRRLRALVRGLTIGDINGRFDYKEVNAYINNKIFRILADVDNSRAAKIDRPYQFENKSYYDVAELAVGMSENWDSAVEHLKRGLIERHFVDIDPDLYVAVQKILEEETNINCAMTRVLYRFNDKIGIVYNGKIYENFKTMTAEMVKSYPEINQDYKVFLDDGVLLNLAEDKYRKTKAIDDEHFVKFLRNVSDIGNRELAYFYFLLFQLGIDDMPKIHVGTSQFDTLEDLGKAILKVKNPTHVTKEIAKSSSVLAYLACYVGLPTVVKIASDLELRPFFEVHLQVLKALEQQTKINFNRIAYSGFGRWLVDNYENYVYVGKEAKEIKRKLLESRLAFKNGMSFKLSDFSKLIDQMEENLKEFITHFNYNIVNDSNKNGIFAKKNEYYLALEYEGEICCLEYKKSKTNVEPLKDAAYILNNEIDKCIGITNRNLTRVNNIFERNSVLKRKREEEAVLIKVSLLRFFFYILIAVLINGFVALKYLGYFEISLITEIKDYMYYTLYGLAGLYDLFFILTFFNVLHGRAFLNKEKKYYVTLRNCAKDINKTLDYFNSCKKELKSLATSFLRNKNIFNSKYTDLDYQEVFTRCEEKLAKHQNLKLPSPKYNHFVTKAMYFTSLGAILYFIGVYVTKLDIEFIKEGFKMDCLHFFIGYGVGWILAYLITGLRLFKGKRRLGIIRFLLGIIIGAIFMFGINYLLVMFL